MMDYNEKIDIIIPLYNVEDKILIRCLSSIACQDIIDEVDITLIDDASTVENYDKIISIFQDILNIKLIRSDKNGGPGVARQIGIDNTNNGYLVFVDADDTLKGSLALKILRKGINANNNKYDLCVADFEEIHENLEEQDGEFFTTNHPKNMIWMFGKIYRRSFIDKYNIRFHPTSRANEDVGFNTIANLLAKDNIKYLTNKVYYWHGNPNSITRRNEYYYAIGPEPENSFYGFVENKIYAINFAKEIDPNNYKLAVEAVINMVYLYEQYLATIKENPQFINDKYVLCLKFYKEVYRNYLNNFISQMKFKEYETTQEIFSKYKNVPKPLITFKDLVEEMEEDARE